MAESRFLKPSVSQTFRYLEPNLVSLGFALLKLYNFTPDFSNPRFLKTPDNLNQFWLQWDKLTPDNLNLWKFRNHLVRTSITFTSFNKLTLGDKLFSRMLITQQATNPSGSVWKVQWVLRITEQKFPYLIVFLKLLLQYINKFCCTPLKWRVHGTCMPLPSATLTALPFTIAVHEPFSSVKGKRLSL